MRVKSRGEARDRLSYASSVIITRAANYVRARALCRFYASRLIKGFRTLLPVFSQGTPPRCLSYRSSSFYSFLLSLFFFFHLNARQRRVKERDTATRAVMEAARVGGRDAARRVQKYSIPSCQTVSEILRPRGISLCISRELGERERERAHRDYRSLQRFSRNI